MRKRNNRAKIDLLAPEGRAWYASSGPLTDLAKYQAAAAALPDDLPSLVKVVQGLILHDMWVARYGVILINILTFSSM